MQVMCLNTWGGKLHDPLIAYLHDTAPEVLCLQEVIHTPITPHETLTYRDGDHVLPQRATLFADLCATLPDHIASFCPAARGELWYGDTAYPSFWGLATFTHRALPIVAQSQGFVHGVYGTQGYGPHPRSRSAHAIRLFDHDTGHTLCVTHMHGLRDLEGKHDTPARLVQTRKLVTLARSVAEPGDAQIICGDFNVTPSSTTFDILRHAGFTDLVAAHGITSTRTSHYAKSERFADYMCVTETLRAAAFAVVTDPEVSDHCPLILTTG